MSHTSKVVVKYYRNIMFKKKVISNQNLVIKVKIFLHITQFAYNNTKGEKFVFGHFCIMDYNYVLLV
jgi:hypothetical protein